MQLNS